jgi:hypothetical protein
MQNRYSKLPEFISKILIYSIHRITSEAIHPQGLTLQPSTVWLVDCLPSRKQSSKNPMPQEVSVSYQAIKSKVYRLIDALVVGEKTEVEIQESIRRWWELIHPADRPIAQKYLLLVLERSCLALDAVEEGLTEATQAEAPRPLESAKALRLAGKIVKQAAKQATLSPTA